VFKLIRLNSVLSIFVNIYLFIFGFLLAYEEYNDLNLKKCNSLETTNTNITIEEPYPKTYLEDDRCSIEGIVLNPSYIKLIIY
jgi:hypothetical protein